jgi:type I restriction enzyme S subunit
VPLESVVRFQEGPGILAKDFHSNGVPLVRLAGLGGYRVTLNGCDYLDPALVARKWSHFKLNKGDIVISTSASFGRPAVVGDEAEGAVFYTGLIRFRSSSSCLDEGYLKTFLGSRVFMLQAEAQASGSVISHFGPSHLRRMEIPLPPMREQQNIARVHSAIDDKIDLNRRMNATLEAMARAIFKDWFVDFGPTRAKMEGRAPYLAPEIWSLFPDRLDEGGKPEGWADGRLIDVAEIIMGTSPDGSTYNDQGLGIPLVNGPVEYGDFFLRRIKWTTAPNKLSRRGDLIVCVRGSTTGRHAFSDGEYCLGRGVCAIRGRDGQQHFADACILFHLDRLLQRTTGSVFPSLATDDIREFATLIPNRSVRRAYCDVVSGMYAKIWESVDESATIAATRDLLLPKLMSGELRVRAAEPDVEAVA